LPLIRAELQRWRLPRPGPLTHDLSQVLYLPFDHDDGSYARDRSGYNNHSTIYGATLAVGKIGYARVFDGVDDFIKIPPNPSLDNLKEFTLAAWVRVDGWVPWMRVISINGEGNAFNLGRFSDTTNAFVHFTDTGKVGRIATGGILKLGELTFLVGTFKRPNLKLYQDGDLVGTLTVDVDVLSYTGGTHNVGARMNALYEPWNGLIDEPRIYNRELSQAEIRRLMYLRGI